MQENPTEPAKDEARITSVQEVVDSIKRHSGEEDTVVIGLQVRRLREDNRRQQAADYLVLNQ